MSEVGSGGPPDDRRPIFMFATDLDAAMEEDPRLRKYVEAELAKHPLHQGEQEEILRTLERARIGPYGPVAKAAILAYDMSCGWNGPIDFGPAITGLERAKAAIREVLGAVASSDVSAKMIQAAMADHEQGLKNSVETLEGALRELRSSESDWKRNIFRDPNQKTRGRPIDAVMLGWLRSIVPLKVPDVAKAALLCLYRRERGSFKSVYHRVRMASARLPDRPKPP